ncbi:MAG: hypothetical protein V2I26_05740, partial [Halieaceae bacterium]|nr:hypothetical protein [Halieaceae bacterium]
AGVTRPRRVTQQKDGISNDAAFKYEDTDRGLQSKSSYSATRNDNSDRYVYDVAAYKLDRMLDLQIVPTAVVATVEGQQGALSDWIDNAITETDRAEQQPEFSGYCKQYEQYRLRVVFDILIHNDDRNLGNILWTKDDLMLKLIDHSRAFRSSTKRPKQYRKATIDVSDLLRARLEALDEGKLSSELSDFLHPQQIDAILARRDLILREGRGTNP